ncbi:MAG: hypothetical protein ACPGVD_12315 [Flavobacteriales bacterium]
MKKQIILLGFVLISFCSFSGAIWIPVNIIFDSTVSVVDMKVLSYEGDTILKYYDLSDSTVKEFDCKSKKYSLIKIRDKSLNPLNKSWYGEFPVSGEIVKLIQFKYGSRTRYVFAKQIGNYYKVWFPLDIPFATYLFKRISSGLDDF